MARNIFRRMMDKVQKPKRNTFDLSFTHNLTGKFGELIPVFCKEVMPGDSIDIEPSFALRLMPMVYPIQSTINARVHFFYVRNKNIWKEWPDFIGNHKKVEMPYVEGISVENAKEMFKVGGIADHFGVPVTVHGSYGVDQSKSFNIDIDPQVININTFYPKASQFSALQSDYPETSYNAPFSSFFGPIAGGSYNLDSQICCYNETPGFNLKEMVEAGTAKFIATSRPVGGSSMTTKVAFACFDKDSNLCGFVTFPTFSFSGGQLISNADFSQIRLRDSSFGFNPVGKYYNISSFGEFVDTVAFVSLLGTKWTGSENGSNPTVTRVEFQNRVKMTQTLEYNELGFGPYTQGRMKLSTLPFRAYESIYNGFYRDTRNNPLIVDGQPEYNLFNTTTDSGPDDTGYHLYKANWESDFLTTATQTPQQGVAPLIGVTGTGLFSFDDGNGNPIYAQAKVGEDNQTIIGIESYDSNLPDGTLQILQSSISAGISIADFRNVNALQRWLERNLRLGFRYKELVKAQFGVDINWSELDMPEFIGGVTKPIVINQISQTVNGSGGVQDSLGSYAGQGGVVGQGKNIRHYCDDYGFVIGILSVVPVPIYTQLMPKMFLRSGCLDYYAPDFGHIGAQPIFYDEVSPLQTIMADLEQQETGNVVVNTLKNVFGYQRAWYDYIQSYDFASGQFRTTLRDFLFNRTFDERPELGSEFLTVDSAQLNNVFVVEEDTDKVLGEMYFKTTMKRPIPEYSIPRLEA